LRSFIGIRHSVKKEREEDDNTSSTLTSGERCSTGTSAATLPDEMEITSIASDIRSKF
jgi:hypothetical protein